MSEAQQIVDLMGRAYAGEAWHGPALRQLLTGVSALHAGAKPFPRLHSVWELVLHVTAWKEVVRRRLEGEVFGSIPDAEDWPPIADRDPAAWEQAVKRLDEAHRRLCRAVSRFPDAHLQRVVPGVGDTYHRMLHGVIHHDLYHAGQIALLLKARG